MDSHTVVRPTLSTLDQIPPFPGPKDEKPVSAQIPVFTVIGWQAYQQLALLIHMESSFGSIRSSGPLGEDANSDLNQGSNSNQGK